MFKYTDPSLVYTIRPRAYETFFMLNSAKHEISKLDKSNLINLLERRLTCRDFHCFCLSNQSFKFNFPYSLKGGYLDFSHLTKLKNIYITEIYMKRLFNHQELKIMKLQTKILFDGFPFKKVM